MRPNAGVCALTQSDSIMASEFISKLARSRPPSASPHLLDHGLQVHLQTCSITAAKWISILAPLWPPIRTIMASKFTSPNLLNHSLQVVSPNLLDYGFQIGTIMGSKWVSKLARSWPGSVTLSSLDRQFLVHLELLSSTPCSEVAIYCV